MSDGVQQQCLSGSRITKTEGTTLRPAALVGGSSHTSPATNVVGTMEPCAVRSMPIRPVAEPCSAVTRTASPWRMTGASVRVASGGVAQVPMAAAGDGHTDRTVTGADMHHNGSHHLQGSMTSTPPLHQTHCPNVYKGGLTTQFPVTPPLHVSPHPLQPRVLAAGANSISLGASTPVEDGCGHNGRPLETQRPPLMRLQGPSVSSMPMAAWTIPTQAAQDNSDLKCKEPAFTDEAQLFLMEQLTDIGKSLDVMNRASIAREERCFKSESAIAEMRASIQDLRRDIDVLQSRFLDMSEVPALGNVHNDMETLRTQHLYALSAIEEQRQEHNQLHRMHGELRQLLADHGKGLQELQVRVQLPDVHSDPALAELREQLGCLTEAVRNEFNGVHESFEDISSRVQSTETAFGGPDVVQLAATLEKEMAARIESGALLQHELASVAVRVKELSNRGTVDGEGPIPELPVVQLALTKAEQSLVASSNLQDCVQEMRQELLKLSEQQMRLEGGLAGLADLLEDWQASNEG